MYIHRVRQRLALGRRRRGRELCRLHAVIQPRDAEVDEGRQDAVVDAVVTEVVQLPLGQHGQLRDGDLQLIHLERDVVAVEVAAVVDVTRLRVHDRIVARRVQLVDQHLGGPLDRVPHRPEHLRHAPQRIVGLHLPLEHLLRVSVKHLRFALSQRPAALGPAAHFGGYAALSSVSLRLVEHGRHQVVVRCRHLVHHHRRCHGPAREASRLDEIHEPDAGHDRRPVRSRQPLAKPESQWTEAFFLHHVARRAEQSTVKNFALADQRQRHVCQLHEVAARAHAAVLGDHRADVALEKLVEQQGQVAVHARMTLQKGHESGQQGRAHAAQFQRTPGARGVTTNDVVLELFKRRVVHAILRHRAEARIDAVNDFVFGKFSEEIV